MDSGGATGMATRTVRRGMGASHRAGIDGIRVSKFHFGQHQAPERPGSTVVAASACIGKEF
jgi:hypothetical protein